MSIVAVQGQRGNETIGYRVRPQSDSKYLVELPDDP